MGWYWYPRNPWHHPHSHPTEPLRITTQPKASCEPGLLWDPCDMKSPLVWIPWSRYRYEVHLICSSRESFSDTPPTTCCHWFSVLSWTGIEACGRLLQHHIAVALLGKNASGLAVHGFITVVLIKDCTRLHLGSLTMKFLKCFYASPCIIISQPERLWSCLIWVPRALGLSSLRYPTPRWEILHTDPSELDTGTSHVGTHDG